MAWCSFSRQRKCRNVEYSELIEGQTILYTELCLWGPMNIIDSIFYSQLSFSLKFAPTWRSCDWVECSIMVDLDLLSGCIERINLHGDPAISAMHGRSIPIISAWENHLSLGPFLAVFVASLSYRNLSHGNPFQPMDAYPP